MRGAGGLTPVAPSRAHELIRRRNSGDRSAYPVFRFRWISFVRLRTFQPTLRTAGRSRTSGGQTSEKLAVKLPTERRAKLPRRRSLFPIETLKPQASSLLAVTALSATDRPLRSINIFLCGAAYASPGEVFTDGVHTTVEDGLCSVSSSINVALRRGRVGAAIGYAP